MASLLARCRQVLHQPQVHTVRRIVVAVVGGTVVLVGVALLVLPGPAFLVIPLGLAILATEFLWARRWLKRARELLPDASMPSPPAPPARSDSPVAPPNPAHRSNETK